MAASLLPDILELISKKLPLDSDYARFRSVCKLWRSVAPRRSSKSLFLICHKSSNYMTGTKIYGISFQQNKFLAIRGPPKSSTSTSLLNSKQMIYVGSSAGWIGLIHHPTKVILLYNPITNCIVDLPNFPKCSVHLTDEKCYERIDIILSSDPAVSPADCEVLIICDCSRKLFSCKIGANYKTWTHLCSPTIYFRDSWWGKRACFWNGNLFLTIRGKLAKNSQVLHFDSRTEMELGPISESYLVKLDEDLLLVLVNWPHSEEEGYSFRLYKVLEKPGRYSWKKDYSLEKVKSLGDRSIFLSHKTSFCVTASEYSGCKANSLYYFKDRYSLGEKTVMKVRVHDLTDHSDVVMADSVATSRRDWELCTWFAPSLQP